jgi:acylphosphatase
MGTLRREIWYGGNVQGVGFRYTTRRIAGNYQVTGYVQNLVDGQVRLVVEGTPAEMSKFVGQLERELNANIQDRSEHTSPATGEFHEFVIRF